VQVRLQLFHPHPVDAGTALVTPHALERFFRVLARDHPLHQLRVLASRAFFSVTRTSGFTAPLSSRGFTPTLQRQLHLHGHLVHGLPTVHGRFALLSVRPFPLSVPSGQVLPLAVSAISGFVPV